MTTCHERIPLTIQFLNFKVRKEQLHQNFAAKIMMLESVMVTNGSAECGVRASFLDFSVWSCFNK